MARLIGQKTGKNLIKQESDIFEDRIIQKLENTVVNYSKFFEGGPFFVTYYSKDLLKSTVQDSIDTSVGILGSDTPLKYNKIEKLSDLSGYDCSEILKFRKAKCSLF